MEFERGGYEASLVRLPLTEPLRAAKAQSQTLCWSVKVESGSASECLKSSAEVRASSVNLADPAILTAYK
jgi:hypothetical protein